MGRLRSRLILAFLVVALLPALPLSLVVRDLLQRSFEPGRGAVIHAALEAGMMESRERLREARQALRLDAEHRASRTFDADPGPGAPGDSTPGTLICRIDAGGDTAIARLPEPVRRWLATAPSGSVERIGESLAVVVPAASGGRLLLLRPLPAGVAERAERLSDGLGLLEALRRTRGAVLRSFIAPFLLTYLALLGVVAGIGLVVARQIARPLEALADTTARVASGRFDTRVTPSGTGEVRALEEAMNRMIGQLELQRKEVARLERQAAWRDLARRLAHEIKNPLTPIQLSVQELGQRYRGDDPAFRRVLDASVEIVTEEVAALRRLVQEFSEFARLPRPVPILQPVAPLLDELGRLYGGERVRVEAPSPELSAAFDAAELRRALINLIDNGLHACRAADRPEQVTLGAVPAGDLVTLTVRDAGCGIPPDALERIFEPSFTTRNDGMGLGLAIVDGIARGHGGRVRVDSTPDLGSTFHLDIPARPREESAT